MNSAAQQEAQVFKLVIVRVQLNRSFSISVARWPVRYFRLTYRVTPRDNGIRYNGILVLMSNNSGTR